MQEEFKPGTTFVEAEASPVSWTLALLLVLSAAASALPLPAQAETPLGLVAPAADDAAARAHVALLPRATLVNDANGNKLFDELERAYAAAPHRAQPAIVSFRDDVSTDAGLLRARATLPTLAVERAHRIVPAFSAPLTLAEALQLARLPEVRQVERNDPAMPELDSATAFLGPDAVVDEMGVTGAGVSIAILDTGFDGEHVDLAEGKIVHFLDLATGKEGAAFDTNGHGTHVASIAAGLGRGKAEYRGVAPGASIVGLRIDSEDDAIAGYEHLVDVKETYGIRIATMSFGFGTATDGTSALERAVDAAWDAGIVCFKSNGNSGPGRATMTIPAAARGILGIGSMLDPNGSPGGIPLVGNPGLPLPPASGFILSGYSSRGPTADGRIKPDLVAPGQAITAAANGTKDGYITFSGTSMASPFAAGSAALLLAANPALTPDEVRRVLIATAEDWGVEGPDVDYGHGRIRVREAVRLAFAMNATEAPPSTEPPVPFHEVRAGVVAPPFAEGSVTIEDTTHPIAATFIAEGTLLQVEIRGPDGLPVGKLAAAAPGRQQTVGFEAPEVGSYTFRVAAPPGTPFVVDFSHGLAPALPLASPDIEGLAEGIAPAAAPEGVAISGAPFALAVLALVGLAIVRRPRAR